MTETSSKHIKAEDRIQNAIIGLLRLTIGVSVVWSFLSGEWEALFISVLAIILSYIPDLIKSRYRVRLPIEFDIVIVLFIVAALFLGEVVDAYEKFWWWDAVLHTASGVVLGFAGFLVLYILYIQEKLKASPFLIFVFSFSFGLALGAVWEIFEFMVDGVFGTNLQKNGLRDTMWDLIVDGVGAAAVAYVGYRMIVSGKKQGVVGRLIHKFLEKNPKIEKGV